MYHLVNVVARHDEGLKEVYALLCFLEVEFCASYSDVVSVLDEVFHTVLQCQEAWAPLDESDAID